MPLRCTMTFYGEDGGSADGHKKWYHYLVVAIHTVSETKSAGGSHEPSDLILAEAGGLETALSMAESYLSHHHPGLKKIIGKPQS
jgi:hypothetical protein